VVFAPLRQGHDRVGERPAQRSQAVLDSYWNLRVDLAGDQAVSLEAHGIGYGAQTSQPGRFYEYPGDPLATGIGTPVNHTKPA
jgi:hypothetical protein